MIKEYLEERKEILYEIISKNREMYEHNEIAIAETKNKIEEIKANEDAASKLFSVKTRENAQYKTEEMLELEQHISTMEEENTEYRTKFEKAENELKVVEQCFEEIENVSRETFDEEYVLAETTEKQTIDAEKSGVEIKTIITNDKTANTERNGSNVTQKVDFERNEIIKKLEFCKELTRVDAKRTYIEIEELIKRLR